MKAIQITVDERLLAALDADDEVKRDGRSAVLRRAVLEYLERKRRRSIREAYRRGYEAGADDLSGWADEATWPEE
jgi:metal-responsive CopG/Arc/MetJ family transcriptional regulator